MYPNRITFVLSLASIFTTASFLSAAFVQYTGTYNGPVDAHWDTDTVVTQTFSIDDGAKWVSGGTDFAISDTNVSGATLTITGSPNSELNDTFTATFLLKPVDKLAGAMRSWSLLRGLGAGTFANGPKSINFQIEGNGPNVTAGDLVLNDHPFEAVCMRFTFFQGFSSAPIIPTCTNFDMTSAIVPEASVVTVWSVLTAVAVLKRRRR